MKPGFIESILLQGAENAIPMKDLMTLTGLSREGVVAEIGRERRQGALILTSCRRAGFYLPDVGQKGQQEIHEFVVTLRARGLHTLKTAQLAARALQPENLPGQICFDNHGRLIP